MNELAAECLEHLGGFGARYAIRFIGRVITRLRLLEPPVEKPGGPGG
mgnify:CR=1 FL=1